MTLTEFLLARIAEDEAVARGIHDNNCGTPAEVTLDTMGRPTEPVCDCDWHIARVLADCERDRQIVELHSSDHECPAPGDGYAGVFAADGTMPSACSTMRLLALPDADHPDYREEWRP